MKQARAARREKWRQIIKSQRVSGQTAAAWCREHQVTQASFFAWKRRWQSAESAAEFVEVDAAAVAGCYCGAALTGVAHRRDRCAGGPGMIDLPSLSSLDRSTSLRIWLASEPADMRCWFDRLAERAALVTGQDPLSGHLFLFRGRRGDRLKIRGPTCGDAWPLGRSADMPLRVSIALMRR